MIITPSVWFVSRGFCDVLLNPMLLEANESASSKYHDLGVFVHTQKIKRGKACGVSVTSGSVVKPPIATDWQTVLSPKIGQRKMKTDGQDRALAGALTCSLQVSRDLLYSHFSPLLVPALCPVLCDPLSCSTRNQ